MNDPVKDIKQAIDACAAAASADEQIDAFHKYFHPNASFIHPLCYIPQGPDSRKRVIGIFLFYRAVIPQTHFDLSYVAFDEKTPGKEGHLFVELVQTPTLRFVTFLTGFRPSVPMHIHFHVVKSSANESDETRTKWLIDDQEDVVQPLVRLQDLPHTCMHFLTFRQSESTACVTGASIIRASILLSVRDARSPKRVVVHIDRDLAAGEASAPIETQRMNPSKEHKHDGISIAP
jgi:hypothetical protein